MRFVNLNQHEICIYDADGSRLLYRLPPAGSCRLTEQTDACWSYADVPVVRRKSYTAVSGCTRPGGRNDLHLNAMVLAAGGEFAPMSRPRTPDPAVCETAMAK